MIVRAMGVVLLAITLLAITGPASIVQAQSRGHAQSRIVRDKEFCVQPIGPNFVQFSAYQVRDPRARLCKELPDVGPATIVIDQVDAELREMTTDIRIIKEADGETDSSGMPDLLSDAAVVPEVLDPITEKHILPKPYPTGIIEFEHTFTSPGLYHAMVTVKNDHGQTYVSQFPFSVGQTNHRALLLFGLAAASVVGAVLLYWMFAGRRKIWSRTKNT